MKSKQHDNRRDLVGRHLGRRIARFIVALLVQAIVLQPAAFAANWNVAQQPLFTINPVYPNAVFMIDDSWSMNDYRLPPPPFFSINNRWPAPGNVTVMYGAGTRTVAAHNEFTLRSSIHNPLAYDPSITYTPWNDNDKPLAAQGTRPNRSENFPPADIGGTGAVATAGRFTERDMRFRGFANNNPNALRNWITASRGTVGNSTGPTGNYWAASPAADRWTWNDLNKRYEQPLANPVGVAIYNPLPGDGSAGGGSLHEPAAGLQCAAALHPVGSDFHEPVRANGTGPDRHDAAVLRSSSCSPCSATSARSTSRCRPAGRTALALTGSRCRPAGRTASV